jgi:hypothetical protein
MRFSLESPESFIRFPDLLITRNRMNCVVLVLDDDSGKLCHRKSCGSNHPMGLPTMWFEWNWNSWQSQEEAALLRRVADQEHHTTVSMDRNLVEWGVDVEKDLASET